MENNKKQKLCQGGLRQGYLSFIWFFLLTPLGVACGGWVPEDRTRSQSPPLIDIASAAVQLGRLLHAQLHLLHKELDLEPNQYTKYRGLSKVLVYIAYPVHVVRSHCGYMRNAHWSCCPHSFHLCLIKIISSPSIQKRFSKCKEKMISPQNFWWWFVCL